MLFETKRLLVREFELADFEDVHVYASNASVTQFQNWGPNSEVDTKRYLAEVIADQNIHPRTSWQLAIVLKANIKVIGSCGLFYSEKYIRGWHVGYVLDPQYWRRGLGTEVLFALLKHAKNKLDISRLVATCHHKNLASRMLLKKMGFQLKEKIENDYTCKGQSRHTLVYQIRLIE